MTIDKHAPPSELRRLLTLASSKIERLTIENSQLKMECSQWRAWFTKVNKKVKWLIEKIGVSREERALERIKWQRMVEETYSFVDESQ